MSMTNYMLLRLETYGICLSCLVHDNDSYFAGHVGEVSQCHETATAGASNHFTHNGFSDNRDAASCCLCLTVCHIESSI